MSLKQPAMYMGQDDWISKPFFYSRISIVIRQATKKEFRNTAQSYV